MRTTTRTTASSVAASLLLISLLGGCGDDTGGGTDTGTDTGTSEAPAEATEPATPEALAAALLQRVDAYAPGLEPISIEPENLSDDVPEGAIAVTLRLPLSYDEEQGGQISVVVAPEAPPGFGCSDVGESIDGCEATTTDDGAEVVTVWQAEEPEEDPGILSIGATRADGTFAGVSLSGPMIPDDVASSTDLEWSDVAGLTDLVLDPVVGPETTPELVAAGEDLDAG